MERVAIIGAGPAGLVAALMARRLGLERVELFEQAPQFAPIGGGLMLHSNGLRVLDLLGLLEGFRPHLRTTQLVNLETTEGRILATFDYRKLSVPLNEAAVVMRYTLLDHLVQAAEAEGLQVRYGHRLETARPEGSGALLRFENGVEERFDVVLACDGVRSRTREAFGFAAQERVIGEAYLRGISATGFDDPTVREIWHRDGRRFGICPLPGERTYFFCSVPLGGWQTIRDSAATLAEWIESWGPFGEDALRILRAVREWERVNYSELREVRAGCWARPPAFLLGDAAHAMTPNLGQGANSAMVDAVVLMRLLAPALRGETSLQGAGARYDALRRPFVTRIQGTARQTGEVAAWTWGPARAVRDGLIEWTGKIPALAQTTGLLGAGYNPEEEPFLQPLDEADKAAPAMAAAAGV